MEENSGISNVLAAKRPRTTSSAILNGATNGATVGGLFLVAPEVATRFFKPAHKVSHSYTQATIISIVAGAAIGAYFSYKENEKMNNYHTALAKSLNELYAQRDGHTLAR